ncbi:hypothetical protein MKEN_00067900 [Mycena kentingensis (nom. inval.)]|nr:hypothetical protein MKEN_00067900 [Mycena kentingensis (nom. inval.)]
MNTLTATTRRWASASVARAFSVAASPLDKEQLIRSKLTEKFTPSRLDIQDISGGCGTFFAIAIASEAFKDIPIVKQHQLVTKTLKSEIQEIHGLQIQTSVE